MFGGAWIALPWFAFNAFALGSPTTRREIGIVLGTFAVCALWSVGFFTFLDGTPPEQQEFYIDLIPYAGTVVLLFKLAGAYWLHVIQSRTFQLYVYFGGAVRSGIPVVAVAYFTRSFVLDAVVEIDYALYWTLM